MEPSQPIPPTLRPYQGACFRGAVPDGWEVIETPAGLEMSAPDGITGSSFGIAVGIRGQATPQSHLQEALRRSGLAEVRIVAAHPLSSKAGRGGLPWQMVHAEGCYTLRGRRMRAVWVCGVQQCWGQYSAMLWSCRAPEAEWSAVRDWLPEVAQSVVITNPQTPVLQDPALAPPAVRPERPALPACACEG